VRDGITAFMKEVGLLYGAFDFIQTPDDKFVFLEINPSGEWGMLEKYLQHPISEALADALLN
jgi:glutathione synthase/RimK-type ligase-like ATP-grasp enzyme